MKKLVNKKWYIILLSLFWLYIIVLNKPFTNSVDTNYDVSSIKNNNGVVGELMAGTTIKQEFVASDNYLSQISLFCATYQRTNTGQMVVSLTDTQEKKVIFENTVDMSMIQDNAFYTIEFSKQIKSKNRVYELNIECIDGEKGNAITIYCGAPSEEYSNAKIDNIDLGQALYFETSYYNAKIIIIKNIAWICIILLSYVLVLNIKKADERMFLIISICMGVVFVFINPFFHPIDESTHFFRSYMISQGELFDTIQDGKIGGIVAENYKEIASNQLSLKFYFSNPKLWNQSFSNAKEFYYNPYMSSVTPVNHAIGAIGIFIGSLLHFPVILVIILGRLADFVFYCSFSYFAIKKARYYKSLFFIIATFPMSIWLAASYSIDPILLSSALLFSSICLRHYFDKKMIMTRKEKIALLICCIFIASVKYLVYTPILLLFLLVPREKFSKRNYFIEWVIAILVVGFMGLLQVYLLKTFPFTEDRNGDVDVIRQVKFICNNILYTVRNFANYIVNSILFHVEGLGATNCSSIISSLIGIFGIFGAFLEKNKYPLCNKKKVKFNILLLGIFFVIFGLTIVSLYVGYTPVGKFAVEGLQTRYLIPIFLFLMIPISSLNIKNNIKNYEEGVSFIMSIGLIDMAARTLINIFS